MVEVDGTNLHAAVARLSAGQLACLRRVIDGRTSKEIAKELGISPHTVDQRLRLAIQILGVDSRFEAARLIRKAELAAYQPSAYQASRGEAYQSPHVAGADASPILVLKSGEADGAGQGEALDIVGETRFAFEPLPPGYSQPSDAPDVRKQERRNDLTPMVRLAWICGLTIGMILALSLLTTMAEGLARLIGAVHA